MKTLVLLLAILIGTGCLLYARVDLGMSWDDMSTKLKNYIPTLVFLAITVLGAAIAAAWIIRRED